MAFNWLGMFVETAVGFLLLPLLLSRLGSSSYGLWVVIGSLANYVLLLDAGARGAVGRYVAFYRAKDDRESLGRVVSTGLAQASIVGAIGFIVIAVASIGFSYVIDVPREEAGVVQTSILIIAISLAFSFPLRVFDGVLWGYERFDLINLADVPVSLLRLALCYFLVAGEHGLVVLAAITLACGLGAGLIKGIAALRLTTSAALGFKNVRLETARMMFGYGSWNFFSDIATLSKSSLMPAIIGSALGTSSVTLFAIANRLGQYMGMFVTSAMGVLAPVATSLHSKGEHEGQVRLYLQATRICHCLLLYFAIGEILLGGALIKLWVGDDFIKSATLLRIIVFTVVALQFNSMGRLVLKGAAKHRLLSVITVCDAALSLVALTIGLRLVGLTGGLIAIAAIAATISAIGGTWLVCTYLKVTLTRFLTASVLPAITASLVPGIALGIAVWIKTPETWLAIVAYGAVYTILWGAVPSRGTQEGRAFVIDLLRRRRVGISA